MSNGRAYTPAEMELLIKELFKRNGFNAAYTREAIGQNILMLQNAKMVDDIIGAKQAQLCVFDTKDIRILEKTFKDYMGEVVTSTQNLLKTFNGDKMSNFLTIENIKEDGPDFINTKQEISVMKQTLEDFDNVVSEYFDEEKLLAKIDDKDISNYYKELYKKLAVDEESSKQLKENMEKIEESEKILEDSIEYLEKIINYLSDNKNYWQIIDDQIIFTSQEKLNEYTKMALDVPDSLQ